MKVQIRELNEKIESKICYLSKDIFEYLKLSEKVQYKFHLGKISVNTLVMPCESNNKCMCFSSSLFDKLLLFEEITLNIWRKKDEIYLGPVVGIFVNPYLLKTIKNGKQSFCVQKHGEAAGAESCLSYYFTIDGIDWKERRIMGYTFIQSLNKWKQMWFPMPDVVYDRGVAFKKVQRPLVRYMKKQFRAVHNIHFLNNIGYLSKLQVHKALSKYPEMRKYIPETRVYNDFEDVSSMLNEFKFIFIKASVGWCGKQVLSIEQVDNKYKLNFYDKGLKEITIEKMEGLKTFVEKFVKGRRVMIQQGIRLLKYNGRNMDMRVLMIKDEKGEWEAVRNHSRIAKENYTITNTSAGGDCINFEDIYPYLSTPFYKGNIPNEDEIANETKKILYYIEKEFGSFGEIGMDMAIDIYGYIWFIEANTRPDKLSVPGLYDLNEIPNLALNIFKYAKFLACSGIPPTK